MARGKTPTTPPEPLPAPEPRPRRTLLELTYLAKFLEAHPDKSIRSIESLDAEELRDLVDLQRRMIVELRLLTHTMNQLAMQRRTTPPATAGEPNLAARWTP